MSEQHTASSNQYTAADILHVLEQARGHSDHPDIVNKMTRPIVEAFWNCTNSFRFTQNTHAQSLVSLVTVFLQVADPKDALANRIRHKIRTPDDKNFWSHRKAPPADAKSQDFLRERSFLRL